MRRFQIIVEGELEKVRIPTKKRNYENTQHWNLDAEYLEPLKEFMDKNIR